MQLECIEKASIERDQWHEMGYLNHLDIILKNKYLGRLRANVRFTYY